MGNAVSAETEVVLRLGAFAGVFAVIAVWELAAPVRTPRLVRAARWRANLGLALVSVLLVRVTLPISTIALAGLAADSRWGMLYHFELPLWASVIVAMILLDLVVYFQHVLFHAVPTLSRLHGVHHADLDFDVSTGLRFHPVEILLSALIKMSAIVALGAPIVAVLAFEVMLNALVMFNHANVSLPARAERWVRRLLVTPDMHRIHHSVIEAERNSNYGSCLSVWDRLLGTYNYAPQGELDIGLPGWRDPTAIATFRGVLEMPFLGDATAVEK